MITHKFVDNIVIKELNEDEKFDTDIHIIIQGAYDHLNKEIEDGTVQTLDHSILRLEELIRLDAKQKIESFLVRVLQLNGAKVSPDQQDDHENQIALAKQLYTHAFRLSDDKCREEHKSKKEYGLVGGHDRQINIEYYARNCRELCKDIQDKIDLCKKRRFIDNFEVGGDHAVIVGVLKEKSQKDKPILGQTDLFFNMYDSFVQLGVGHIESVMKVGSLSTLRDIRISKGWVERIEG